jgi:virulence-associated protein VagC
MITKEGDRLIVEPMSRTNRLGALFASWKPLLTEFPEIVDAPVKAENVF